MRLPLSAGSRQPNGICCMNGRLTPRAGYRPRHADHARWLPCQRRLNAMVPFGHSITTVEPSRKSHLVAALERYRAIGIVPAFAVRQSRVD